MLLDNKMLEILQRAKDSINPPIGLTKKQKSVNPTVPANVFKAMVTDFKANGGKFVRSDDYTTGFKPIENIIRLNPLDFKNHKGGFRSIIAHELGHSFTTPNAQKPNDLPSSIPKFKLNHHQNKNAYDKPYSRKNFAEYMDGTIYDELNADLEVLRRMKLGGATKAQLSDYAKDAIQSIKTYKIGLIAQSRGTYSDFIAVKTILLNSPTLSKPTNIILSKDPELISDFDKLLNHLNKLTSPQETTPSLKTNLDIQRKIAWDNHKKLTDELDQRLTWKDPKGVKLARYSDARLNNHATQAYLEKNLSGYTDFKKMISETIKSFRIRELEKYIIKPPMFHKIETEIN